MTIQKTTLPYLDEETGIIENTYGYLIDLVISNFPIMITGTESKQDLKRYFLQTCNKLFDQAYLEYESKNDNRFVYQCGMVD